MQMDDLNPISLIMIVGKTYTETMIVSEGVCHTNMEC